MPEELSKSLLLYTPELIVVMGILILFLMDALWKDSRRNFVPLIITVTTCIVASVATAKLFGMERELFFSGLVANDSLANFFRYFFFFTAAASAYLAFGSRELEDRHRMEFCILLLCVVFGLCLMATATNLLTLYIGIETVSIISFVMAGFHRDNLRSNEASLKYLIYGALASGVMVYGFSLLYGITGSLNYSGIALFIAQSGSTVNATLVTLTMGLIYMGVAYKVSAFPMHFWTPDVYEGAPTPVVTFFSVAPKAAGFAVIIRMLVELFGAASPEGVWHITELGMGVLPIIAGLSAITMVIGNLAAIGQNSVKRMLAYSSIAHVGYMLMGLITPDLFGLGAIVFYLIAYCAMNLGAFWVVSVVVDQKGHDKLDAFRGIGFSMPVLGVCMTVFMLSLAGIPMFSGFIGKFWIFGAVLKTPGYLWLALLGVINSVISLYYYAKVMRAMWLEGPEVVPSSHLSIYHGLALVGLAVPTVVMGLYFAPVIKFVEESLAVYM